MIKFLTLLLTPIIFFTSLQAGQKGDALLITSKELQASWQDFVRWKAKAGISVKVQTVEAIDNANRNTRIDVQEKIRQYIHSQKNNSLKWVILGGDSLPGGEGVVPDRDTPHTAFGPPRLNIPTDIFYLSEGNWDADGDGIFGEYPDDKAAIDYSANITIGRIPVRTRQDVAAYTAKVIEYEVYQPSANYLNQMIYTCPVSSAEPKLESSWETIQENWPTGNRNYVFSNRSSWDKSKPGDYDLSPGNFIDLINQNQAGKFHIHGHGHNHCWVLEDKRLLTTNLLGAFKNKGVYPVITTVSCYTGQFDSQRDPSITEGMLRLPNAGAILIIAPSREGKPHFLDRRDMRKMVSEGKMDGTTETLTNFWIYAQRDNLTMGEAFTKARADLYANAEKSAGFHMLICELNLLGDPTLSLKK